MTGARLDVVLYVFLVFGVLLLTLHVDTWLRGRSARCRAARRAWRSS